MNIEDALLVRAKQLAATQHSTLGHVIEDALRRAIFPERKNGPARGSTRLRTFRGNGVLPGVDLDSNAALTDLMEDR